MAVQTFLDFEKPIAELEARVAELRETAHAGELDLDAEIGRLEAKSGKLLRDTYSKLTPWQKAQVARHPERPHFKDYVAGLTRLKGLADYVTVNVSSPNTPGLRDLQGRAAMDDLLGRLAEARAGDPAPVFLKIAPDLTAAEIGLIVEAALDHGVDALIVSNTTLDRPKTLRSRHRNEAGGLSGAPLRDRAMAALLAAAEASAGRLPLIAVGGIDSGEEAYRRIRAGASAVQLYSALVYEGPGLIGRIKRDLAGRLKADGFSTAAEAAASAR